MIRSKEIFMDQRESECAESEKEPFGLFRQTGVITKIEDIRFKPKTIRLQMGVKMYEGFMLALDKKMFSGTDQYVFAEILIHSNTHGTQKIIINCGDKFRLIYL